MSHKVFAISVSRQVRPASSWVLSSLVTPPEICFEQASFPVKGEGIKYRIAIPAGSDEDLAVEGCDMSLYALYGFLQDVGRFRRWSR